MRARVVVICLAGLVVVGLASAAIATPPPRDRGEPAPRADLVGVNFVENCRFMGIVPHVAQNISKQRGSAIDARTTRHDGYAVSQVKRKLVEEIFGWMKTVGNFRRTRHKGRALTQLVAYLVGGTYNLLRIAKLTAVPAPG